MSTPAVAAGAAALGFYVWVRQWQQCGYASVVDLPLLPETHARTEAPPTTWSETLYLFKEAFRYMYQETFGRWHAIDLFFGLAYLSRKPTTEYPAADIAAAGRPISRQQLPAAEAQQLLQDLQEVRRYMLYCQGLRHHKPEQQKRHWHDLVGLDESDIIKHNPAAGLLRPAYVILKDQNMRSIILCVRGTHSRPDMFTSLTGTVKPHHVVTADGVVLGYSHLGMLAAARWLMNSTKGTLITALQQNPGYSLKVVGHSMGGGTAAMLTMMFRDKAPELSSATAWAIACPACMTLELAQSCAPFVTTVVHGADIVPTFSAGAIDKLRQEVTQSSWYAEFQSDIRQRLAANFSSSLRGIRQGAVGTAQWTQRNIIRTAATSISACYSRTPRSCYSRSVRTNAAAAAGTAAAGAAAKAPKAAAAAGGGSSSSYRAPLGLGRRLPGRARASTAGAVGYSRLGVDAALPGDVGNALYNNQDDALNNDEDAVVDAKRLESQLHETGDPIAEQNPLLARSNPAFWWSRFTRRTVTAAAADDGQQLAGYNADSNARLPMSNSAGLSEAMLVERALEACLSAADAGQLADIPLGGSRSSSNGNAHAGDATAYVSTDSAAVGHSSTAAAAAAAGAGGGHRHRTAAGNFMRGISRAVLGKRPAAPSKKNDDDADDDSATAARQQQQLGLAVESAAAAAAMVSTAQLPVSSAAAVDLAAAAAGSSRAPQAMNLRRRGWGLEGVWGSSNGGWVSGESGSRSVAHYIGQTVGAVGHTGKVVLETTGQLLRTTTMFQTCAAPHSAAAPAAAHADESPPGRQRRRQRRKQQHDSSSIPGSSVLAAPSSSGDLMRMDRDAAYREPDPFSAAAAAGVGRLPAAAAGLNRLGSSSSSDGSSDSDESLDDSSSVDPDLLDESAVLQSSAEGFDVLSQPAMQASISALMAAASTDVSGEGMSQQQREEAVAAERLLRETGASNAALANLGRSTSDASTHGPDQQQQQQPAAGTLAAAAAVENSNAGPDQQGQQDAADADAAAAAAAEHEAARAAERIARRQMYPAGRIFHLMPSSVVAAAQRQQQQQQSHSSGTAPMQQDEPNTGSINLEHLPPLNAATGSVGLGDSYVLLEVDNVEVYGRMRLCPAMVRDHFIPSYLKALDSVTGQVEDQIERATGGEQNGVAAMEG